MKPLDNPELDRYRIDFERLREAPRKRAGAFVIPRREGDENEQGLDSVLLVIATSGGKWDHCSVSVKRADKVPEIPTYEDMQRVYRFFFKPTETAMQLHVPQYEHVNINPWTLHLWRPLRKKIPKPPPRFV